MNVNKRKRHLSALLLVTRGCRSSYSPAGGESPLLPETMEERRGHVRSTKWLGKTEFATPRRGAGQIRRRLQCVVVGRCLNIARKLCRSYGWHVPTRGRLFVYNASREGGCESAHGRAKIGEAAAHVSLKSVGAKTKVLRFPQGQVNREP